MKLILFIVFALVVLWCFFGCGDIGGGRNVDNERTHQIDTMPDSTRVKDTVINDSLRKRKALLDYFLSGDTNDPRIAKQKPRPKVVSNGWRPSIPGGGREDTTKAAFEYGPLVYTHIDSCKRPFSFYKRDSIRKRKTGQ